jgi:exosortase
MEKQPANGILEDFRLEFLDCWQRLPNKGLFFILLAAWLALFQCLGNSTLGYISTPSLLQWMYLVYQVKSDAAGTDDSHGMFIPFIVLALLWWKRKQLLAPELKLWSPGLLLVGLGLGLHLVGYMVQQPRISIVALFTGIYGLMGLAWGRQWLRDSFFPFFLFAFCVPLGWSAVSITFPLRLLVSQIVEWISGNLLQIDIIREGTSFRDSSGLYLYDVAPACSGIRSLFATLAVAVIFAFLSFRTWWKRLILIAAALPLAVFGNVVRMLTIVITAEIWGPKAGSYVHEGGPYGVLSLLPYVPAFAGLFLVGHWLREPPLPAMASAWTPGAPAPVAASAES